MMLYFCCAILHYLEFFMFDRNETVLLRRAVDCLRERLERSARKTDHQEIYALMRKDIFALEELLSKLEVV